MKGRMKKYTVFLTGGKRKTIKARTPTQAKHKYYGSQDHFRTERSVLKVSKYKR